MIMDNDVFICNNLKQQQFISLKKCKRKARHKKLVKGHTQRGTSQGGGNVQLKNRFFY